MRVARWLTDGSDSDVKDRVLCELWDETVAESISSEETGCDACGRLMPHEMASRISGNSDSRRGKRLLRLWQRVAASLLVALGVAGALFAGRRNSDTQLVQVYCSAGDLRTVVLPDGSEVMLNGGSSIVYPKDFTPGCREVMLMGEAGFKVARDTERPFIVRSDSVSVTALGTEFNVRAYPDHPCVESTLLQGKVKVSVGSGGEEFILNPSEQLVYDRKTAAVRLTRPEIRDITAWQRGELVLSNLTLSEILKELETRFSQQFIYQESSLPSDRYTFRFNSGMNLEEIMDVIKDVAGNLSVTVNDRFCKVQSSLECTL